MNASGDCLPDIPSKCLSVRPSNAWPMNVCDSSGIAKRVYYSYEHCQQENIVRSIGIEALYCGCYTDMLEQCEAGTSSENKKCHFSLLGIGFFQVVIMVIGFLLNCIIVSSFFRKAQLRSKIPNVLLLNQAGADIVNILAYGLPNSLNMWSLIVNKIHLKHLYTGIISLLILTITSSVLLFLVIAFDRFMAIFKPFWHRANVRKRHIWISVLVIWLVALIFTVIPVWMYDGIFDLSSLYLKLLNILLGFLVVLVIALHIATFFKALVSLRHSPASAQ